MKSPTLSLAGFVLVACLACRAVPAAAREPDFDVQRYAARVKALMEAHEQLRSDHRRLLERKSELHAEFVQAQAAVERLQLAAAANQVVAQDTGERVSDARQQITAWFETLEQNDIPAFQERVTSTAYLAMWGRELEFQSRRINNTGRAIVDNMRACLQQVTALQREFAELPPRYEKLQADLTQLVDIPAQRSREELSAALDELGHVSEDNPAALMVRGVALRRLSRFAAAQADFAQVGRTSEKWRNVALAAHGESLIAEGKARQGLGELNQAVRAAKSDPTVLYLYALGLAEDGKHKAAERAWTRLLALDRYDAVAHRNLAFLYSAAGVSWRRPEDARQHAGAACDLTEMSDWSCLLAFSTTYAANEQYDLAVEWAEHAADLSLGDQRELCRSYIEKYQARECPTWDWNQ